MFGESHMRFYYDLVVQSMGLRPPGELKHVDDSAENLSYYATHYITQGPDAAYMIEKLRATVFGDRNLLMITFGSWELHVKALAQTVLDIRDVLVPELAQIKLRHPDIRILVFTSPAKFLQEGASAGIENTASVRALLEATQVLVPTHLAEVLDVVTPSSAFLETVPLEWDCDRDGQCQCHMLCRLGAGANVSGRVGEALLRDVILRAACHRSHNFRELLHLFFSLQMKVEGHRKVTCGTVSEDQGLSVMGGPLFIVRPKSHVSIHAFRKIVGLVWVEASTEPND